MTDPSNTDQPPRSSVRTRSWPVLKWLFFAIVLAFIARRAGQLWMAAPEESVRINGFWLIPAGLAYFVGWLPSVWLWRAFLLDLRQPLGLSQATRAYYVGHLGKYVPGKALVLVIRASMVKDAGVDPLMAGMTAACETLVYMATGTALAVAFAPMAFGESLWPQLPTWLNWFHDHQLLWPPTVMGITFATTPISAALFTRICRKKLPEDSTDARIFSAISATRISQGVIVNSLGWSCHALSLGCVLQSISIHPFDITQFPVWLVSCALSTVAGFVVLIAPGGLGVREELLIELLKDQPLIGIRTAVVAAFLLRAVWFATELATAGILMAARVRFQDSTKRR